MSHFSSNAPATSARIVNWEASKMHALDESVTLGELLNQQKQDAEVRFSALMKEAVHLAKKYGFKIRPVNCEK